MKTIVLTHQAAKDRAAKDRAAKDLDAVPASDRLAVADALTGYAVDGPGDIERLSGRDGYRLRVGGDRIIFAEDQKTILAISIGRRSTMVYHP